MKDRLVWALLAVSAVAYVATVIWWLVASGEAPEFGEALWTFVMVPVPVIAGAYLMWKRPENPIGMLLTTSTILTYVFITVLEVPTLLAFGDSGVQSWMWAPIWGVQTLTSVGIVLMIAVLVILPDGHFRYPRERRLVAWSWLMVLLPTLTLMSNEVILPQTLSFPGIEGVQSPLFVSALESMGPAFNTLTYASYLLILVAIVFMYLRYREAMAAERKQIRWVLYAGSLGILVSMIPYILGELGATGPLQHNLTAALQSLPILLVYLSIVVAVIEPAWVDVDIVIRKSFVYGALSFVILLLYVGVAAAFGVVAAEARLSIELAVTLTVVVAILFQPARRRLQAVADRWVFGVRPSRYEAVTEFGETIEESDDPGELLPRLVETIRKTLRLQWVSATLDDGTRAEAGSVPGAVAFTVPIGVGSEEVGNISCGPKVRGTLDDDERHLVSTLAAQVGLAVMNARLAGRIVNAAEAERRRIERNIHDGAQQELVALVARLAMARAEASRGALSPDALADLQREAQHILSDLRDLAQGIHPSVLTDGGILEAVEDRCTHLPIEVSVHAAETMRAMRFGDDIEGAAYFFVSEALANVLKHANASHVDIEMERTSTELRLGVTDDGRGFDARSAAENGLAGLSDRIRALGGSMTVTSRTGRGTTLRAEIPVGRP